MKQTKNILWGVILVIVGVLFGLSQMDLLPFDLFFKGWWTLFILVPSVVGLITDRDKMGSLVGLLFGVFFLLAARGILAYSLLWKLALPVLIVLLGLYLLVGGWRKKNAAPFNAPPIPASGHPRAVAVFSGEEVRYNGEAFHGLEAIAVFGGVDGYLYNAQITEDCTICATAVFGGVELHLPAAVNVKVEHNGVFGGVENHVDHPFTEGLPTVYVRATAIFGGVEIH
ncbi:MAG: hypothetical protein E7527_05140 [Ruminococcaceae bacterium]|nr:hypothetical protein [Oscillospiraceae bacterium]